VRIFQDANVLFATAISPEGRSAELFRMAQEGLCILVTSPHAVEEARRNIVSRYPKSAARLDNLLEVTTLTPEASPASIQTARQRRLPEEDLPILAAAVGAEADVLVTGDKTHSGHLFGATVAGVRVIRLADALALLLKR
jgi:predicted nucleic acid-binding protein